MSHQAHVHKLFPNFAPRIEKTCLSTKREKPVDVKLTGLPLPVEITEAKRQRQGGEILDSFMHFPINSHLQQRNAHTRPVCVCRRSGDARPGARLLAADTCELRRGASVRRRWEETEERCNRLTQRPRLCSVTSTHSRWLAVHQGDH